jgi:hypothetical protein
MDRHGFLLLEPVDGSWFVDKGDVLPDAGGEEEGILARIGEYPGLFCG